MTKPSPFYQLRSSFLLLGGGAATLTPYTFNIIRFEGVVYVN